MILLPVQTMGLIKWNFMKAVEQELAIRHRRISEGISRTLISFVGPNI